MLLAFGRDKPESGRAAAPGMWRGFWSSWGQLSCYNGGPGWSCPETGPSVTPPGLWLQTQMEKGQEKHLPPSSSALSDQLCPAYVPSTSGAPIVLWLWRLREAAPWARHRQGRPRSRGGLSSCPHGSWSPLPALPPRGAQALFPAGDGQWGLRFHWLEPFRSKS